MSRSQSKAEQSLVAGRGVGKAKFMEQVRTFMRARRYSLRTEQAYLDWIRRFILFSGKRHPTEMGESEIVQFLTYLAAERKVAPSTQNQAFSALLFLYQQFLERRLGRLDGALRANRPSRLPVVLTRAEVRAVLAHIRPPYRWMADLLYGSGLRLLECLRLSVKDMDFGDSRIIGRHGKGVKDSGARHTGRLRATLSEHLHRQQGAEEQD